MIKAILHLELKYIKYGFLIVTFSLFVQRPNIVLITKQNKSWNWRGLWEKLYCALYQYQSVNCLTKYFPQDLLPSVNLNSLALYWVKTKQNKTNIVWMEIWVKPSGVLQWEAPLLRDNLWFLCWRFSKILIFTKFHLLRL